MLFSSFVVLSFLASALAVPSKRFGGLGVSVTGPSSVSSIDDVKLIATVTNNNAETVKILKFNTVLDSGLTASFRVEKEGAAVKFQGIAVSVSIPDVSESEFAVIAPGESISVEHNLAELYDFEAAGVGAFSFAPLVNFVVAPANALAKSVDAFTLTVPSVETVTVTITDDVKKREHSVTSSEKRAVVSCSNASQASFISASYSEAKTLATRANSYLTSNPSSSITTAYWKTNSLTTVRSRFTAVANESGSRPLSCSDPYGVCTGGVIAYTVIATTYIYYCSIFYNEVAISNLCSGTTVASRNVRGGTTLHELTHALSGTDDVTYGCAADQALSAANQLRNADNYNCFSTQAYQTTGC